MMNLCSVRRNIYRYLTRPHEHCKPPRFIPNMMYSIAPDKILFLNRYSKEVHHYFTYLSHINKYKPYFYNFTDEIYDIGMKQRKLSPFLKDLVTTLHSLGMDTVSPQKITLPSSTQNRLNKEGLKWLSSIGNSTNQNFLNDLQFVGLLWCFTPIQLHFYVAEEVYKELEKRYFSFDIQSCLRAATFLYIYKTNKMLAFRYNVSELWLQIVKKLYRKSSNLSDAELIVIIFVCGLARGEELKKIINNFSYRLEKKVQYLSPDEVGVIALSNFLSMNKKFSKMGFTLLHYFMVNIENMNEISFSSCCKYLKNIKPALYEYELEHVNSFLMSFHQVMSSFSSTAIMQGYLFLLTQNIFTKDLLEFFRTIVLESDLTSWRSKELSYYCGIIGRMYPLFPESHAMLSSLLNELCNKNREKEINWFHYQTMLALDCASRAGYYPTKLIENIYGKQGYENFKDHLLENYEQHECIMNRMKLDEPELFKKIPPLNHKPNAKIYAWPQRKMSSFFEDFINVSTKEFGCEVAKTVYNFNSDVHDLELRVKDGKLVPVDEWQEMDGCIKVVLVYTVKRKYQYVIGKDYNIYYEVNGSISSKLRLYEKSGYTILLAKEEKEISELPRYFNKLMDDVREICENSETNDVKVHYL